MHIYIYIYRERERYIQYIIIHTCMCIYIYIQREREKIQIAGCIDRRIDRWRAPPGPSGRGVGFHLKMLAKLYIICYGQLLLLSLLSLLLSLLIYIYIYILNLIMLHISNKVKHDNRYCYHQYHQYYCHFTIVSFGKIKLSCDVIVVNIFPHQVIVFE